MKKTRKKPSKKLLFAVNGTLGAYLQQRFNLSVENSAAVALRTPYILLANHTNFWDPFFLSLYVPEPVSFVTSDEYFRHPLLKFLLKLTGAIPKSKFTSDSATVLDIFRVKRSGGVIGIFPEGKRNWDGRTGELLFATAKLVKSLRIPVMTATLKGAHLSFPRWAKKSRKGRIVVSFGATLMPEEIAAMSPGEIHRALSDSLAFSELDYQRENPVAFEGGELAENLELYLFVCPECRRLCSLTTHDDTIACTNCGFTARYGRDGFLSAVRGKLPFSTPGEWGAWQEAHLRERLRAGEGTGAESPLFGDQKVTVRRGKRLVPLKKISFGQMRLLRDRIEFVNLRRQTIRFSIDRISGLNVQYNNQFEFYYDDSLYRFSFRFAKTSAYKWVLAIRLIRELQGDPILTD